MKRAWTQKKNPPLLCRGYALLCALLLCALMCPASASSEASEWQEAFLPSAKPQLSQAEKVHARILAWSDADSYTSFVIDKGSADQVEEGMSVLTPDGLVGYISAVEDHRANVTTLLDGFEPISIQVEHSRDMAVLSFKPDEIEETPLYLLYPPIDFQPQAGDRVYTAGLEGTYPDGILVGTLADASEIEESNDSMRAVNLTVHLANLDAVDVLLFKANK